MQRHWVVPCNRGIGHELVYSRYACSPTHHAHACTRLAHPLEHIGLPYWRTNGSNTQGTCASGGQWSGAACLGRIAPEPRGHSSALSSCLQAELEGDSTYREFAMCSFTFLPARCLVSASHLRALVPAPSLNCMSCHNRCTCPRFKDPPGHQIAG